MSGCVVLAVSSADGIGAALAAMAAAGSAEVVTLTLDVGQGQELEELHERALQAGAARAHVLDVREEYTRDFVLPSLHASAMHGGGGDPLALPLAHILIAKTLVDVAAIEGAGRVAHGASGADADRIDATVRALNPALRVTRVARDGRRGPAPGTWRSSATLWGREIRSGGPMDGALPEEAFVMTTPPATAPEAPASVSMDFERGVPVAVNGVPLGLTEMIDSLSTIAGRHGAGRILASAGRDSAGEGRRALEAPAAVVLHAGHAALEAAVTDVELVRLKRELGARYAALVWRGRWYGAQRRALDAFNADVQRDVTGTVRVQVHKGCLTVLECRPGRRAAPAVNRSPGQVGPQGGDSRAGGGTQLRARMASTS